MKVDKFLKRLKELNLRFALGDIDKDSFVKAHKNIVVERICALVVEHSQLQPYIDLIVRCALPEKDSDIPEWIVDKINYLLFTEMGPDKPALDDFISALREIKIGERKDLSQASFGIMCVNSDSKLLFAEIIPRGQLVPIKGDYYKAFRLSEERQQFARIPLGFRVDNDDAPERLDGVELRLDMSLMQSDEIVVTLSPQSNHIQVSLECKLRGYKKNAILEFKDTLKEPPEDTPEAFKLRHLVNQILKLLDERGSALEPELRDTIIESLCSACQILRFNDNEELRSAYKQLIDHLQKTGVTAEGFFAYKAIEYATAGMEPLFGAPLYLLPTKTADLEYAGSIIETASSLQKELYDAVYYDDLAAQKRIGKQLSELALKAIIDAVNEKRIEASKEEIAEFLGISFNTLKELFERIGITVDDKLEEAVRWLPVVVTPRHQLFDELKEFFDSPLSKRLSNDIRDDLLTDAQRIAELDSNKLWISLREAKITEKLTSLRRQAYIGKQEEQVDLHEYFESRYLLRLIDS